MVKNINFVDILISLLCSVAFTLFVGVDASAMPVDKYASESALSQGRWVKIKVAESGVHVITQNDAVKWGFTNINKIKVYGYGGAPIDEKLNEGSYIDDLPLVPVKRVANKLYFYAQGPITWTKGANGMDVQVQHPYSESAYYFVTQNDSTDVAMKTFESTPVANSNVVNTFIDRVFHEKEIESLGETGRQFFGEDFRYNSSQSFKIAIPDYVAGTDVKVMTNFAANTQSGSSLRLRYKYNGTQLPSEDKIDPVSSTHQHARSCNSVKTFSLGNTDNFTYNISIDYSGVLNAARLDYITVNYTRRLAMLNGALSWSDSATGDIVYSVSGANEQTTIWDVTDALSPIVVVAKKSADGVLISPVQSGNRNYVAFSNSASLPSPQYCGTVRNQNLHAEPTPDMIIITLPQFASEAKRVATLHEKNDGMRVMVVEQDLIFNEFSSGTPDAMAYRKLCKMFYDRGADEQGHKLKYLLLFGSGSYDNKLITDKAKAVGAPMLLTYQSQESLSENSSYTTDDVFAMLEDDAATSYLSIGNRNLSIAVGRMPVHTLYEARSVVDKLYKYVNNNDFGSWKTNAIIVADDGNEAIHMKQAESIIDLYTKNGGGNIFYNRVYLDAYDVVSTGGGVTSEVGRTKLYNLLGEGALWFSFIGHANPTSWTSEHLMTFSDINGMYNKHLPFLFAATCEFARFDANALSGGEILYLNPQGGVIAELSATRLAYIPNNGALNNAIAKYVFARDTDGKHYTIGEFVRRGKNDLRADDNKLRYALFGDPAMRLKYPEHEIVVEQVNGYDIDDLNKPDFQARQVLTFEGRVQGSDGNIAEDFNGTVVSTLYDAEQSVETLGRGEDGAKYVFQDRSNKLAMVSSIVENGKFKISVRVPSELNAVDAFENYCPSRLNLYAYNETNGEEAMGATDSFYIYGYDEDVESDSIGPEIRSFVLNGAEFEDGGKVNESPLMIAEIFDESGINFSTGGIGHNITLMLDGKINYGDVASFFSPLYDSEGNAGSIIYPLSGLDAGEHTLKLKVWDVFNNSSEKTIKFKVDKNLKPELLDVYAYGSPASEQTVFYVEHNRPDAVVTVRIDVFDLMGRPVWTATQTGKSDMYRSFPITWNLCDSFGNRVPRGIYVYRATISTDGKHETSKAKKLAVAAQ